MVNRSAMGARRSIGAKEVDRLFAQATKQLAFEARMRGADLIGMDARRRIVVLHPDGTTSPFKGETRTAWNTKRR